MLPYQQRVCIELRELTEKIDALTLFMETFSCKSLMSEDIRLLHSQLKAMQDYQTILAKRIARFKVM